MGGCATESASTSHMPKATAHVVTCSDDGTKFPQTLHASAGLTRLKRSRGRIRRKNRSRDRDDVSDVLAVDADEPHRQLADTPCLEPTTCPASCLSPSPRTALRRGAAHRYFSMVCTSVALGTAPIMVSIFLPPLKIMTVGMERIP